MMFHHNNQMHHLHCHHKWKDHQYTLHPQENHLLQEYPANIRLQSHILMNNCYQAHRLTETKPGYQRVYNKDHHTLRLHKDLTNKSLK